MVFFAPTVNRLLFNGQLFGVISYISTKKILPAAILAGAALLTAADLLARLLVAPAEIPIGIITSLVGAPFFILLLKQFQRKGGGLV